MRVGVVILPELRWPEARERWHEAEQRGFSTAWTYDHLSWRSLRDGPWLGAVPLLTAAAASTSRLRIGTLVTSPNFRHPALLAKDVMTIDEISGGRLELGIGAGGTGFDAHVTGEPELSARDRSERFVEFVDALDLLLREPAASHEGRFFTVRESRTWPGCTQQPRVPFTVAATGPRGLDLTARQASTWVSYGPVRTEVSADEWFAGLAEQSARLDRACAAVGRDPHTLSRAALVSLDLGWAQHSISAWQKTRDRLEDLGFSDVIVHWPRPQDPELPGPSEAVFDAISRQLG